MPRFAALLSLLLCLGLMSACSSTSRDVHTFESTDLAPKTVSVIATDTGESLWTMDVPAGQKLVIDLNQDGERAEMGFPRHGYASEFTYRVYPLESGATFGQRYGEALEEDTIELDGPRPVMIHMAMRAPEPRAPGRSSSDVEPLPAPAPPSGDAEGDADADAQTMTDEPQPRAVQGGMDADAEAGGSGEAGNGEAELDTDARPPRPEPTPDADAPGEGASGRLMSPHPGGDDATLLTTASQLRVQVLPDGHALIAGERMTLSQLRQYVEGRAGTRRIVIDAERNVQFRHVIAALEACEQAGIPNVAMAAAQ